MRRADQPHPAPPLPATPRGATPLPLGYGESPSALSEPHRLPRVARPAQPAPVGGVVGVESCGQEGSEVDGEVVGVRGDVTTQDAERISGENQASEASMSFALVVRVRHRIAALAVSGVGLALAVVAARRS